MIVDEEGDALGIPKLRRLRLLEYFRGESMGSLPTLMLLSLLDLPSSPSIWILENFLHAKLIATSLEGLVHKNNTFLQFQSTCHELIFLNISYCHKGLSKALALKKKLHFACERSNAKLRTESVKNSTDCKDEFVGGTSRPQIRKFKTRER